MNPKLLIAGVGNVFLGDDAFGVEVAQRLAQRPLPDGVRVVDFGIRSYDLAYALMDDWDQVILVDAVPRGGTPGTVYLIEPELPSTGETPAVAGFDAHSMDPVSVLQLVAALGGRVKRMLIVGCEPFAVADEGSGEIGLSEPVRAAIEEAVRVVEEIIGRVRSDATAA